MTNKPDKILKIVRDFDSLPDDAVVPTSVTARLTGLSERTVRYHPTLSRRYLSPERYGQRAGDVRRLLRDGWQSLGDAAARVVDACEKKKSAR